jgi:NADH-quinone oxidoreductase subunit N
MIASDFTTVLPEVLLSLYAMLALVVFVYTGKDRHAGLSVWLTSGAFMLLALILAMGTPAGTASFGGMFIDDSFARFCKIVILLSAALVLVMGQDYAAKHDMLKFEYPLLVALSVVGMMVMVSAGSLLTLYMGLELQSLALYVIAAFRRDSAKSTEAGLKYFVLGALSSGLLLLWHLFGLWVCRHGRVLRYYGRNRHWGFVHWIAVGLSLCDCRHGLQSFCCAFSHVGARCL